MKVISFEQNNELYLSKARDLIFNKYYDYPLNNTNLLTLEKEIDCLCSFVFKEMKATGIISKISKLGFNIEFTITNYVIINGGGF